MSEATNAGRVNLRVEGAVAVLTIANPPVNALAQPVREALLAGLRAAEADPAVRALLITGAGRHFVAGADIREFDAAPRTPLLNDVLLALEACPKPVIAALNGLALGGGLELALASHYRCAAAGAMLGLPEVKLGLLPGSGGTQRLPRLVGAPAALDLMLGGLPISAEAARGLGILDRVLEEGDALIPALAYARELVAQNAPPRPVRRLAVPTAGLEADFFGARRAKASREAPGLLAPGYIVECVEAALREPFDEALALSRRRFEECRQSVASRSLRHLFFAERPGSSAGAEPRGVARVAVIGAGTMGAGIAISLATSGHEVVMIDPAPAALAAGEQRIASTIEAAVAKGRLARAVGAAARERVTTATALEAAATAELVIEAVFESMAVKREVFAALDRVCGPAAVLATNTSTLDVDEIASATRRPGAVVGMHFFSPANVMRLVEIVRASASEPEVVATALAVTKRMGKLGIVVGNGFGFVGNRMLYAYGAQNQLMLLEGASPAEIDAALKGFGMAMGPNAVGDLAGLDIGYRVRRERKDRPSDPRWYRVADALVEAGRLGQKNGRGAYRYADGSREPLPDPEVEALIVAEAARLGVARRHVPAEEIVARCTYALINEGARLLEDGIAFKAADIDAIWCNGYGFPRLRGGPMFHAGVVGLPAVLAGIEGFAKSHGRADWTPAPLLAELAASGRTFEDWDLGRTATGRRGDAPMKLRSYVHGRWVEGAGEGVALKDATTGAVVGHASSAGLDFKAVLDYARGVGGPGLRALTFHERAARLRALGKRLQEWKDEFYALSYQTGATKADSWIDIDGGIGTLLVFASKGSRELPDSKVFIDGGVEPLSKGGTFIGQHICVPLEGAAVHINAFNFPVWGMLEKLAPTLLAGVPAIVKPATSTAYLTEAVVRRIVESGILPEGALQLVCGSLGDLFEHLTCQDAVSFTGSAATARTLKSHPVVVREAVRFLAETDSLNCSVLAPGVTPDLPEFGLFVREIVREMTVKAGQKCTAIRRALVPRAQLEAVAAALKAALADITPGDPRTAGMGPLASLEQRREVLARIEELRGETTLLAGDPGAAPGGEGLANGGFVAPVLLLCREPLRARAVHEVEAFGPVATLMPYGDLDEAIALARRGGGSLVASVFAADATIAARLVLGLAPYHGRILVVDRTCAKESTGHGSPLAPLVHGGPGRAGGGEEMGGMRGVMHYLQRVAVQGSPTTISTVTGRWVRGATELAPDRHPFRIPFGELRIGDTLRSIERLVTVADIEAFAALSGDHFYAHMSETEAARNPLFGGRVAHGYFLISAAAGLFVDPPYGPVLGNYGLEHLRFVKPVKPGDRIKVRVTCKEKALRPDKGWGEVTWDVEMTNQDGETVAAYDVLTMVSVHAVPDAAVRP